MTSELQCTWKRRRVGEALEYVRGLLTLLLAYGVAGGSHLATAPAQESKTTELKRIQLEYGCIHDLLWHCESVAVDGEGSPIACLWRTDDDYYLK